MSNSQHINYVCRTYLADGKTVSANEVCATAEEAVSRAKAWRAVGHKANAVETVFNWEFLCVCYRRLD